MNIQKLLTLKRKFNIMKNAYFELLESNFHELSNYLDNVLPHGSGINCNWEFDYQRNGKVIARNSYHCMDEDGYYCGYADFTLKFSMHEALTDFELEFNGKQSRYLNRKFMLRDYLEDIIYHSLPQDRSILQCLAGG